MDITTGIERDLKEIRNIAILSKTGSTIPRVKLLEAVEIFLSTSHTNSRKAVLDIEILEGTDRSKLQEEIDKFFVDVIFPKYDLGYIKVPGNTYVTKDDSVVGILNTNRGGSTTSLPILTILPYGISKEVSELLLETFQKGLLKVSRVSLNSSGLTTTIATMDLKEDHPVDSMFPSIELSPSQMWEEFRKSKSNVMLLIGKPGLGKSSYIREMIRSTEKKNKIYVVDSQKVALHPSLADFIRGRDSGSVFVIEDADSIVKSRELGNESMQPLLNVASGVIPTDTKLIISTNLPSIKDVDEALLRPGRMFKILEFEEMSVTEANQIRSEMDLPDVDFGDKKTLTLAEAINWHELNGEVIKKPSFGFN